MVARQTAIKIGGQESTAGKNASPNNAGVAQLVERQLPKLNVASSSLVTRSRESGLPRHVVSRGRPLINQGTYAARHRLRYL